MGQDIEINMGNDKLYPPIAEFTAQANINSQEQYQEMYKRSIEDPNSFWGEIAEEFTWKKKWDRVLNWDNAPFAKWFEGAQLNITENCLDRHIAAGKGDKVAIHWEGEPGDTQTITYADLHSRVCAFANVLKNLNVQKGDRIAIYLPMIPELAVTVLACARVGAVHSVIFAGFSAPSLVDRINDSLCKVVVTSDGLYRRGKVLGLKAIVDEALESTPCVDHCVVVQRCNNEHNMKDGRDQYWSDLHEGVSTENEAEVMDAEDPLFILYTSGSTGKPKGIQHTTAGYMIWTHTTFKYIFDIKDNDIFWCTADLGWITGHSYFAYGPMANGATQVMYEGAPNHPNPDRFWEIVEKYKVSIFYTAPTAIRAFMKWGDEHVDAHDLSSLRLLGTVGEMINPAAWDWYHKKIGAEKCPIVDTWWQTETGGIMLSPLPGITATKPGSATIPFFGVNAAIVDEKGNDVEDTKGGLLVIKSPWPGMLRTIYGDTDRYKEVYWERFEKQGYYLAGDGAVKDENGYFTILGRIDDVINVSGHRLSTMELESAFVGHELVVESAVVGFDHEIKGTGIAAFVTLKTGVAADDVAKSSLIAHIAKEIGPFAKPDQIRFTDSLPKTRSGKIMRRLLRDVASNREIQGDTSTIEDLASLAQLSNED